MHEKRTKQLKEYGRNLWWVDFEGKTEVKWRDGFERHGRNWTERSRCDGQTNIEKNHQGNLTHKK